ncbi:MAG TPA: hypothetical protein PKE40_00405 [Arachnia sp.]|nr:hypothetical protein [Arachnia sp.]HMT84786.1 hypothetical protein [Arachnia sp.]
MFTRSKTAAPLPDLIRQLQGSADVRSRLFPVPDGVAEVLPDAGLRRGCSYALEAPGALLLGLLAEPSRDGAWCGVVGIPELGAEAAHEAGVAIDRLVLVPDPGRRWLSVVAALAEVLGVIAVRPSGSVSPADANRLASRLRDREATMLVVGPWPRVEATLRVEASLWSGVGTGYGHLEGREATLSVTSKRYPVPRRTRLLLPGPDGRVAALARQTPAEIPTGRHLQAVS